MARDYRVFVNHECLEALPRSGKRRDAVIDFFQNLGPIAHLGGDFQVTDPETLRQFEVTQVAGFAVTWWVDRPVYEVKVVDVRSITS